MLENCFRFQGTSMKTLGAKFLGETPWEFFSWLVTDVQ